jgi:hypothetical protein
VIRRDPLSSRLRRRAATRALVMAAVVGLVLGACGDVRPNAATVDGRAIPRKSFLKELTALRNNKQLASLAGQGLKGEGKSGTFDARLAARWLDRLVVQAVIDREFERRHLKVTPSDRPDAESALADQFGDPKVVKDFPAWFRDLLLGRAERQAKLQSTLSGAAVTDATAKAFYDKNANLFTNTCVSHILVKTKQEATDIAGQLARGADFATVAKQKSTDPGSGPQGGSLGCEVLTKFVREFGDAAAALPVNQLSPPVHSQFGWHLILVSRRDPAPSFDSIKTDVTDTLTQRTRGQFAAVIGDRLQKASVTVDPRFGRYRFDANNGPVIDPPTAPNPPESPTSAPAPNQPAPGGVTPLPGGQPTPTP